MYSVLQRALLPPLAVVFSIVILALLFVFGKRPLYGAADLFGDRMEPLYAVCAGGLLGQLLFLVIPNAALPNILYTLLFLFGSFFLMNVVQTIRRVWHTNPYYVEPEANYIEIRHILDEERIELKDYYHANDLEDPEVPREQLTLMDEAAELKRRRWNSLVTCAVLCVLCLFEGFYLLYRPSSWLAWSFFLIDKLLETLIFATILLHGMFHAEAGHPYYLYGAALWVLVLICSCIPLMVDTDYQSVYQMVNHLATGIFYGIAGGILLWSALYFLFINRRRTQLCEQVVRNVIVGATGILVWLVALFS